MPSSPVCVDASFLIRLLEAGSEKNQFIRKWREWTKEGRAIVAPTLLFYEVANALFRYALHGELRFEEACAALEAALALPITLHADPELHLRAMHLAKKLGFPATYDAHYLALAERLGAEFWTADCRLAAKAEKEFPFIRTITV